MNGITYNTNIIVLNELVLDNASVQGDILNIKNKGKVTGHFVSDEFMAASQYLRLNVRFKGLSNTDNYTSKAKIEILLTYSITDRETEQKRKETEYITCSINTWEVDEEGIYTDSTYIDTLGYEVESLDLRVSNESGNDLIIYTLEIAQSLNVETITTAREISYYTSIRADIAKINTLYAKDVMTERLETNMEPLFPHNPYPAGGIRQYFSIYENEQEYREDTLSDTEVEPYKISGVPVYYNLLSFDRVIGTDTIVNVVLDRDAYSKTDPVLRIQGNSKYSDTLKEAIRGAAAVYVRKVTNRVVKKRDTDGKVSVNGTVYNTPVSVLGAGDGTEYTGPSFGVTLNTGKLYNGQVIEWKDEAGKHTVYLKNNTYTEQTGSASGLDLGGGNVSIPVSDTVIFHDVSDKIEVRHGGNVTMWEHTRDSEWDYLTSVGNKAQRVRFKSSND